MFKEVTPTIGGKIEPMDLRAKKDQPLIPCIIMGVACHIKKIEKIAPQNISKIYARCRVETPSYKPKLSSEVARGKPSNGSSRPTRNQKRKKNTLFGEEAFIHRN